MMRFIGGLIFISLLLSNLTAEASRTCSGANNTDFLQAASNAAYNISAFGNGSVAMWLKRGNTAVTSLPLYQPTGTYGVELFSDDKVYASTGGSNSTSTIADTTTWHHVAITWASTTIKVYIDGTDVTNASSGHILAGQDAINVCTNGANPFNGKVAYVAVWNTALSAANVTTLQTSTTPESVGSGNVASWHLCNTGDLTDSSATNNPLVTQGAGAVWSSDNPGIGCGGGGAPDTEFLYRRRAS